MITETEQLDYTDTIVSMMIRINDSTARPIALDLWKYYPVQTSKLYAALAQTQHTKKVSKLEGG